MRHALIAALFALSCGGAQVPTPQFERALVDVEPEQTRIEVFGSIGGTPLVISVTYVEGDPDLFVCAGLPIMVEGGACWIIPIVGTDPESVEGGEDGH